MEQVFKNVASSWRKKYFLKPVLPANSFSRMLLVPIQSRFIIEIYVLFHFLTVCNIMSEKLLADLSNMLTHSLKESYTVFVCKE